MRLSAFFAQFYDELNSSEYNKTNYKDLIESLEKTDLYFRLKHVRAKNKLDANVGGNHV